VPSSLIPDLSQPLSRPSLSEVFASVPDPRDPRGVRHPLASVLVVALAAVAAGARTLLGISEWAADADRKALARLGIGADVSLPSESTIRRTLAGLDGNDLDARIAVWMATRVGHLAGRTVIAVDGKSLRGGTPPGGVMPHLLAAMHHGHGVVAGQRAVSTKSNEIPALPLLLAGFDLQDVVVTADALHCQRATAAYITSRGGHYVLTVKGNQPRLRAKLKALPWTQVPATTTVSTSHGRRVRRTIRAVTVPDWVGFPGAAQVLQIRRTRNLHGRRTTEVVYAICSLDMIAAPPATVATWIQGHWSIENALHWVRDVVFDEDRHQLRTGSGPHVMATLRNTAISLLRLAGHTRIAAALRHHARDPGRPIDLILAA
jgi:predicted transposase YbfD/YdcC